MNQARKWLVSLAIRSMLPLFSTVVALSATALAEPPEALNRNATRDAIKWQPATDYDRDGCYPTPAVGRDAVPAEGLATVGAINGECRDEADLNNTNSYVREKCNAGWCGYVYGYYFEKDQLTFFCCGHRHDWEHVVIWVQGDEVRYVSASAHGDYNTRSAEEVRFEGSHAKIVYHKDGLSTHAFRFAEDHDDPPENHFGAWQFPDLLSWQRLTGEIRNVLNTHDYGSAKLDISDARFNDVLSRAKPEGIPFDPFQAVSSVWKK